MAHKELAVALSLIVAISPVSAANPEPTPTIGAPTAPADAEYCLRIEPYTGSNIETIQCNTREEWAYLGLDVDKEWAKNGVDIKG